MSRDAPSHPSTHDAQTDRDVDPQWVSHVVGVVQVLAGAARTDVNTLQRALSRFAHDCPAPRSTAERLVLKGILLDAFLWLETTLDDDTTRAQQTAARSKLLRELAGPIDAFADAASHLIGRAARMRAQPLHDRACHWIEAHIDERHTIREMAARLGTNPRTLTRHFTRHIGMTTQQYQWQLRASKAARLLAETDLTVTDVADAVGVRSKSTLYRIMRRSLRTQAARGTAT
jgi:AraC-like DNA-binding protein